MTTKEKILKKIAANYNAIVECYGDEDIAHNAIMYMIDHADACVNYDLGGESLKSMILPRICKASDEVILIPVTMPPALDVVLYDHLSEQIASMLSCLNEFEKAVIVYKFGFVDGRCWSLSEIASKLGYVSGESIRQIEAKALRKLRHPSRSVKIKNMVDGNLFGFISDIYEV